MTSVTKLLMVIWNLWLCVLIVNCTNISDKVALFYGKPASGTSSLINAIYGEDVADVGIGNGISVTKYPTIYSKSFTKNSIYGIPENFTLHMVDTPGLEDEDVFNSILFELSQLKNITQIDIIFITESLAADSVQLFHALPEIREHFGVSIMNSIVVVGTKPLLGLQNHGDIRDEYLQSSCGNLALEYMTYESKESYDYQQQLKSMMHFIFDEENVRPYNMDQIEAIRQNMESRIDELMQITPPKYQVIYDFGYVVEEIFVETEETYIEQGTFGPIERMRKIIETKKNATLQPVSKNITIKHTREENKEISMNERRESAKINMSQLMDNNSSDTKMLPGVIEPTGIILNLDHGKTSDVAIHNAADIAFSNEHTQEGYEIVTEPIITEEGYEIIEKTHAEFEVYSPYQKSKDIPYVWVHSYNQVNIYGIYEFSFNTPAIIHLADGSLIVIDTNKRTYIYTINDDVDALTDMTDEFGFANYYCLRDVNQETFADILELIVNGKDYAKWEQKKLNSTSATSEAFRMECGSMSYFMIMDIFDLYIKWINKNIIQPINYYLKINYLIAACVGIVILVILAYSLGYCICFCGCACIWVGSKIDYGIFSKKQFQHDVPKQEHKNQQETLPLLLSTQCSHKKDLEQVEQPKEKTLSCQELSDIVDESVHIAEIEFKSDSDLKSFENQLFIRQLPSKSDKVRKCPGNDNGSQKGKHSDDLKQNNQQQKPFKNNNNNNDKKENGKRDKDDDGNDNHKQGGNIVHMNMMKPCGKPACVFQRIELNCQRQINQTLQKQLGYDWLEQEKKNNELTRSKNGSKKTKKKTKKRQIKTDYEPSADMFRGKGNISFEIINKLKSKIIEKGITNLSVYLDKTIAIQCNAYKDEYNSKCEKTIIIFNVDLHNLNSEILYVKMQRVLNHSKDYKWIMNDIYTKMQLDIGQLRRPVSERETKSFIDQLYDSKREVNRLLNEEKAMDKIINRTKWTNVKVFTKSCNKKGEQMTLSLTVEKFRQYYHDFENRMCKKELKQNRRLIPILMFGDSIGYSIEVLTIIKIKTNDIPNDIGISFKYNYKTHNIQVAGIHLDKRSIYEQHQLVDPQHMSTCYCLHDFTSNIENIKIGELNQEMQNKIQTDKQIQQLKHEVQTLQYVRNLLMQQSITNTPGSYSFGNTPIQPQSIFSSTPNLNNQYQRPYVTTYMTQPPTQQMGQYYAQYGTPMQQSTMQQSITNTPASYSFGNTPIQPQSIFSSTPNLNQRPYVTTYMTQLPTQQMWQYYAHDQYGTPMQQSTMQHDNYIYTATDDINSGTSVMNDEQTENIMVEIVDDKVGKDNEVQESDKSDNDQ